MGSSAEWRATDVVGGVDWGGRWLVWSWWAGRWAWVSRAIVVRVFGSLGHIWFGFGLYS